MPLLFWGSQSWTEHSRFTSPVLGKGSPVLTCWQCSTLAFFASEAHCSFMVNMLATRNQHTPFLFFVCLFFPEKPIVLTSGPLPALVYASPDDAGFSIFLCWISLRFLHSFQFLKVPLNGDTAIYSVNLSSEFRTIWKFAHHFIAVEFCLFFCKSNFPQEIFLWMSLRRACCGKLRIGSRINIIDSGQPQWKGDLQFLSFVVTERRM